MFGVALCGPLRPTGTQPRPGPSGAEHRIVLGQPCDELLRGTDHLTKYSGQVGWGAASTVPVAVKVAGLPLNPADVAVKGKVDEPST